jgi:ClpP class serine protease
MRYAHLYSRLISTPWFIDEGTLSGITRLIESRINGVPLAQDDNLKKDATNTPTSEDPATLVIPIEGVIGKRLSMLEMACGGCDMDVVRQTFDAAQADPAISQVILSIDSGGGTAIGNHELFNHMLNTKQKPLYTWTDTLMGSAATYLGAASDAIFASPTSMTGSVGSYLVIRDDSVKQAREGVSFKVIRSGQFKGTGIDSPLSEDELGHLQATIDYLGAQFRADMSNARPRIAEADMQGLTYLGEEAQAKGFVDHIVPDFNTLLAQLS